MAADQPTVTLPTELIDEKTFYTLSGASVAVWLFCWVISYVAEDVSWLNYKFLRLLALIISEALAILIMYKTKKSSSMKWFFAFLNGLLIFVNASGLNTMTSSSVFNPKPANSVNPKPSDSTSGKLYPEQQRNTEAFQLASIIPLPHMINWWPDEKLIEQHEALSQEKKRLESENNELKNEMGVGDDAARILRAKNDSLQLVITAMQTTINEKQRQYEQLVETIKGGNDELTRNLKQCLADMDARNNELRLCRASEAQLNRKNAALEQSNKQLQDEVKLLRTKSPTLSQLLQQVCNKVQKPTRQERQLMQREDFRKVDWNGFCKLFNVNNNPPE